MKKNQTSKISSMFTSPVFFLLAIVLLFVALFSFFGSKKINENGGLFTDYEKQDGKAVIVEYGDYQCPACINEYPIVENILNEYKDKVVFENRHFPLSFHEYAMKAAVAAECARDQGKFKEMHDALYQGKGSLTDSDLKKYANDIGLNAESFNSCLDSDNHKDEIQKDVDQGTRDGIGGTPTFYINGRLLVNSENSRYLPRAEDFKREIELELSKAK